MFNHSEIEKMLQFMGIFIQIRNRVSAPCFALVTTEWPHRGSQGTSWCMDWRRDVARKCQECMVSICFWTQAENNRKTQKTPKFCKISVDVIEVLDSRLHNLTTIAFTCNNSEASLPDSGSHRQDMSCFGSWLGFPFEGVRRQDHIRRA